MKKIVYLLFLFLMGYHVNGQLVFSPLSENSVLVNKMEKGILYAPPAEKSSITVFLPFIDDFSRNHQPGALIQLWDDNFVFVNPTYGVNPVTIGVATFDGLNWDGYPYDFENPTAYGDADVLTSCMINLNEDENGIPYLLSDSIILSFLYQPTGLGDKPETEDSLVLEFYDADAESWVIQWNTRGIDPGEDPNADFKWVLIPVNEERYLRSNFRLRFRNKATLSGNVDHWNIDMVWMDENRVLSDTIIPDVGYQFPVNQMLNNYTSMPYSHYKFSASAHMKESVDAQLRNNQTTAVNLSNVKMRNFSQGVLVNETPFPGNTNNFPAESSQEYAIPLYDGGNGYVFDPNVDSAFASFENQFTMASGTFDLVPDNDTIMYKQVFENYYSYDDGSAEIGIGLNVNGGRLACRYQAIVADSIVAFKMYFNPIVNDPVFPFFMVIWDDNLGVPGEITHFDENFSFVKFVQEGPDIFSYYILDNAVYVAGTYYIGLSQTSEMSLNLGFDRNTNTQENIFFKTGISWQTLPESNTGSLMMRPVFQSELDSILLGINTLEPLNVNIYPNPTNDHVTISVIDGQNIDLQLLSLDGRVILETRFSGNTTLNTSDIPSGLYLINFRNSQGSARVEKLLISH